MSLILDDRPRARASRAESPAESEARIVERLVWVDMEDWSSVFDISKACTLRASRASRYGSVNSDACPFRDDWRRLWVGTKRLARRGDAVCGRTGGEPGGGT